MPRPRKAVNTFGAAAAGVALAVGLAACGGGSSKAPGITPAPSAGLTTTTTTAATPTTTAPVVPPPQLAKKPVVTVPSGPPPKGLVIKDVIQGSGPGAISGDNLVVNYVGLLYSGGKEFDSSWKHGKPYGPFSIGASGGVIPGWNKGLVGLKVGGRRELIIPPDMAYGKGGNPGGGIPPNATLVFVVDLLKLQ
jgi:peptidylprolyl isomerase